MNTVAEKCIYSDRECIHCGECRCDLDPGKVCDNCMACVTGDADYSGVWVDGIFLEQEEKKNGNDLH